MKKPNFENGEGLKDICDTFQTIDEKVMNESIQEAPKEDTTPTKEPEEVETIKEDKKESKTSKKQDKTEKEKRNKPQIFSEVDSVVVEYLNLKSIVTGLSKKEILNKIFKDEIKKTFNLSENASEDEMQRAIEKKTKQIEQMKSLF